MSFFLSPPTDTQIPTLIAEVWCGRNVYRNVFKYSISAIGWHGRFAQFLANGVCQKADFELRQRARVCFTTVEARGLACAAHSDLNRLPLVTPLHALDAFFYAPVPCHLLIEAHLAWARAR